MKIGRWIATIALLVGLIAGGLGGLMAPVPEAAAQCDFSSTNGSDDSLGIGIRGGQGSGDDCN